FQAEDGIRDDLVTGVQTCALPILRAPGSLLTLEWAAMARTTAEWQAINERVVAEFRQRAGATGRKNPVILVTTIGRRTGRPLVTDRKSTRLNSSHQIISYAVFRLK